MRFLSYILVAVVAACAPLSTPLELPRPPAPYEVRIDNDRFQAFQLYWFVGRNQRGHAVTTRPGNRSYLSIPETLRGVNNITLKVCATRAQNNCEFPVGGGIADPKMGAILTIYPGPMTSTIDAMIH